MLTIQQLATHLEAELIGNAEGEIKAIQEVTFITHPSQIKKTTASILISDHPLETSKTVLIAPNPKLAFAKTLELFQRHETLKPGIDPRAWVEENTQIDPSVIIYPFVTVRRGAKIGKNVVIYPGVYIGQDARIDQDSILYPHVTLFPNTHIVKRVILHAGSIIGDDGFGFVWDGKQHYKIPQIGKVIVEDDVEIGSNTAIDRATTGETRIKQGTKIDNLVQIGHNVHIGNHCILCSQVGIAGSSTVGDGSMLGGQAGIPDHIDIAPQSKIAAQAGILRNTEPGETLLGSPAMPIKEFFRMMALWKQLPQMSKDIHALQKELDALKERLDKI